MKYRTVICHDGVYGWDETVEKNQGKAVRAIVSERPYNDIEYILCGKWGGYRWHRTDGPARILRSQNAIFFILHDHTIVSTREFCQRSKMSDQEMFLWLLKYGEHLPYTCSEYYGERWTEMADDEF